jgi:eukaryotic-like serine/threonine-protein kinase
MEPKLSRRIEDLYQAARERPPADRGAFLAGVCGEDEQLRRKVESLLSEDAAHGVTLSLDVLEIPDASTRTLIIPGIQLGPYRIERALGKGGMGEVFQATDTRLNRKVAIKTGLAAFGSRFAREARAIAALNHPNVCTLYDVGANYLVMELIEGETLAERLRKGPLAIGSAIRYGTQVADALVAAHAHGIVHRDLKPGNIMITKSGIKVLDFGLAKSPDAETITAAQAVIGTPAYMAPEQKEGRPCDCRTDIYALGLILHEMATGKRPVAGIAAGLPRRFAHIVERCLSEDPDARWQSARDVKAELGWAAEPDETSAVPHSRRYGYAAAAGIGLALALAAFLGYRFFQRSTPADARVVRLAIPLPEEEITANPPGALGPPAISPDGRSVAFPLGAGPKRYIWLRNLDSGRFDHLQGTGSGNYPFWSPDGKQIGFFADGKLKKIAVSGGDPLTLCAVTKGSERGGTWNASGTILYGVNYAGLFRVADRGGDPVQVAGLDPRLGENSLRNPAFLSDGKHFIAFSRTRNLDDRGLYLYTLGAPGRKKLGTTDQEISVGRDVANGQEFILFSKSGKLWAHAIDPHRWELKGDPSPIEDDVGLFSASNNGTLVFRRADVEDGQFTWLDRSGRELQAVGTPVDSWDVNLSPDDRYVAFQNHSNLNGRFSIWLIDTSRNVSFPFSVQTERSFTPVWSPDGSRVYFYSPRPSGRIFVKALDASGMEQALPGAADVIGLEDVSRNGKFVLALKGKHREMTSLVYGSFGKDEWRPLLTSDAAQIHGQFSPDGRWVAYESHESGAWEIYVVDFPDARRRQRISVAGGREPRWWRDGKELIYYAPEGALMIAGITNGVAERPKPLFKIRFSSDIDGFHYAASHDGQRILAMKESGRERSRDLNVVINWPRLLSHNR